MGNAQRNRNRHQQPIEPVSMPWEINQLVLACYDYDDGTFSFKLDQPLIILEEGKDQTVLVRIPQTDIKGFVDWHYLDGALQTRSRTARASPDKEWDELMKQIEEKPTVSPPEQKEGFVHSHYPSTAQPFGNSPLQDVNEEDTPFAQQEGEITYQ